MTNKVRRITQLMLSFILMAGIFLMTDTGAHVSAAAAGLVPTEIVSVALDNCAGVYVACEDADGVYFYLYNKSTQKYEPYKDVEKGNSPYDEAMAYSIGGLKKNSTYKFMAVGYTKNGNKIITAKKGRTFTIKTLPAKLPDAGDHWTPENNTIDVNLKNGFDLGYIDRDGAEEVHGLAHGVYAASVIYGHSVGQGYDSYIKAMQSSGYTVKSIAKKKFDVDNYIVAVEQYSVSYKGKRVATLCKVVLDMGGEQGGILMFSSGSKFNVINAVEETDAAQVYRTNAKTMYTCAAVFATDMEVKGTPVKDGTYFADLGKTVKVKPTDPKDVAKALVYYDTYINSGDKGYGVVVYKDGIPKLALYGEDEQIMRQIASMNEITPEKARELAKKYQLGYYPD